MAHARRLGDVTVIELDAEYDALDRPRFERAADLVQASAQTVEPPWLVLDLSRTAYIGSAFIDVIVRASQSAGGRGGRVVLAGVQPFCAEVLHAAQLDTKWELFDTLDEAVAAIVQTK